MSGFRDFSLIVFVVLLFCFCQFCTNTIFFCAKCVLFSRVYSFSHVSKNYVINWYPVYKYHAKQEIYEYIGAM